MTLYHMQSTSLNKEKCGETIRINYTNWSSFKVWKHSRLEYDYINGAISQNKFSCKF